MAVIVPVMVIAPRYFAKQIGLGGLMQVVNAFSFVQNSLAFARILLVEPALLFLDEATSALDEPSDTQLYSLLRTASWRPTVVSVGHRNNLRTFHDYVLDVADFNSRPDQLLARSKSDLDVVTLASCHTPGMPSSAADS